MFVYCNNMKWILCKGKLVLYVGYWFKEGFNFLIYSR